MPQESEIRFPDPFEPSLPPEMAGDTAQKTSLARQLESRARILATTRRVLAETGHERLTLKRISDECDVAVQTIRNNFGRREDLIVAAVNEHTTSIWKAVAEQADGARAFIAFSEMIHECAKTRPGFLKGSLSIAFSNNPSLQNLQSHAASNKTLLLRKLAGDGQLRRGIDLDLLASQITKLDTILMYDWAQNGDTDELCRQMVNGHKVLLLGAMRDPESAGLLN